MDETKLKSGDNVMLKGTKTGYGSSDWDEVVEKFNCKKGDIHIIKERNSNSDDYYLEEMDEFGFSPLFSKNDLELVKKGKQKPEDLTRFMVYGQGCNNMSNLLLTETEVREESKKRSNDSNWSGRLIVYKMVPIFEAENRVFLNKIKPLKK